MNLLQNPFASLMGGGGAGGMDLGAMLNNPAMMQMAQQMMSNPQIQQQFAQIASTRLWQNF